MSSSEISVSESGASVMIEESAEETSEEEAEKFYDKV